MPTTSPATSWQKWFGDRFKFPNQYTNAPTGLSSTFSGNGRGVVRDGNTRLDEFVSTSALNFQDQEPLLSRGERASGTGSTDGSPVRTTGGRLPDGTPAFDQVVPHGGYLWWYVDAISDDGLHGITIIAFVGSVFSPYYAWANRRALADPNNYCCLNVAIYSPGQKRWTMTERGQRLSHRDTQHFQIGPSDLHWTGSALEININERAIPFGQKVLGKVTVHPELLFQYSTPLDAAKKHRWGPIAPTARVTVALQSPTIHWQGHAYLDSNEGDEPISRPFNEWDWARALLKDGSTAVIYDVREKNGVEQLLCLQFLPDGNVTHFTAGDRQALPKTLWRIQRHLRTDRGQVLVNQDLEDTPFYSRSILKANWLEQELTCMHETLNVGRFSSPIVQMMLPWRMPRLT